jgi:hypothetical protein
MRVYLNLIPLLLFTISCKKDKPVDPNPSQEIQASNRTVLIINEGNYGWGNASISLYDPQSNTVTYDYFKKQNGNANLGDVCQSVTKYNGSYYLVLNNSNKIIVVNASDFAKKNTITEFNSPRNLLPVSANKAYVTDLYANSIQVVDLNLNIITGNIACMKGTEEMVCTNNKAFITNIHSNYCYVINTISNEMTDSILVGKGASSIVLDKYSKIWVLSKGSSAISQLGSLNCINPHTLVNEKKLTFKPGENPWRLTINKTQDTLYYLNTGVYQLPINHTSLPLSPLIVQGSKLFYGLGVNPDDHSIYVSDAIDYVQKSKVEIYSVNGAFIKSFNAGIISNGFVFE